MERGLTVGGIALIAALVGLLTFNNDFPGVFSDSIRYLLIADFFEPYGRQEHPAAASSVLISPFPPLYPMIMALFGATHEHVRIAHGITGVIWVLAIVAFLAAMRRREVPVWVSLMAALTWIFLVQSLALVTQLASEGLFFLLISLTVYFSVDADNDRRTLLLAGLFLALAALTRSATIAFVPAFLVLLATCRQSMAVKGIAAAAALVPPVLWHLFRPTTPGSQSYSGNLLANYSAAGPWGWVEQAWEQAVRFGDSWVGMHRDDPLSQALLLTLGVLGLAGLLRAAGRRDFLALGVGVYLVLIILWPYPDEHKRLLLPVVPFFLVFAFGTLDKLFSRPRWRVVVSGLACAFVVATGLLHLSGRMTEPLPAELDGYRLGKIWLEDAPREERLTRITIVHQMVLAAKRVPDHVDADGCVFASFSDIVAFYSMRTAYRPPPQREALNRCNHFLLVALNTVPATAPPLYPLNVLGNELRPIFVYWLDPAARQPGVVLARRESPGANE